MDDRKVKELSVEGVLHRVRPTKHFVYSVRVTWSDGMVNVVYRRYKQFLELEKQLLDAFPNKQESIPTLRAKCPNSPGAALKYVEEIAAFVETLINLPAYISSCVLVLEFFKLTEQDLSSITQNGEKKPKKATQERKNEINTKKHKKKGRKRMRFTRRMKTIKDGLISGPVVFEQYTVLETYKKQNKNDINLTEGQVVEVIEKRDNGWWFVEADEQLGWAPASFLQNADLDEEDDFIITSFPRGKGEIYMTTKSYKAAMQDELSFDIGVNLQIVERNYCGWWRAIYMGKEGFVPAAYLKKIGSSRHSVLQRQTREKKTLVVSRLEETILEEAEDNVSLHSRSSYEGQVQRRKLSPSNPQWRNTLPAYISHSAPGSPERTARHLTLPQLGRPVRTTSNLDSYSSKLPLTSPLTLSENFMGSAGKIEQPKAKEERAVSFSECEQNSTASDATSLSSLNKQECAGNQLLEANAKTSVLTETEYHTNEEGRLENEDETDSESDSEEEEGGGGGGDEKEEEKEDDNDDDEGEGEEGEGVEEGYSFVYLPSPIPPPQPPPPQPAGAKQTQTSLTPTDDDQVDELHSSYPECHQQTFTRQCLSSIQESDESSSDEDAVFTIDISGLSDNPQPNQETFRAIASYEGDEDSNEITITEGEIVEIIQKKDSGWWLGLANRQIGWVPSNYLEPLTHASETQDQIPSDTQTEGKDTRL